MGTGWRPSLLMSHPLIGCAPRSVWPSTASSGSTRAPDPGAPSPTPTPTPSRVAAQTHTSREQVPRGTAWRDPARHTHDDAELNVRICDVRARGQKAVEDFPT